MNVQRIIRLLGLALALSLVSGCNPPADDSTANSLREALVTQDKHAARLAELEGKLKKAEKAVEEANKQAAEERAAAIKDLEKKIEKLAEREPSLGRGGNPDLERVLQEIARELKNRPNAPAPDREAMLKYSRAIADTFLTATLARNDQTMAANLTNSYKATIAGENKEGTAEYFKKLEEWSLTRSGGKRPIDKAVYQESKIDEEIVAPSAEEALFKGTLTGTGDNANRKATFMLRVVKDKESGKLLIDCFNVKHAD